MKLMILDGNSIVNRAFYGIRMLNAPDGTPTNAVYGFLTIFQRILELEQPQAVCVAFDVHAPTFRHEQYARYKAQRKPMPEELRVQVPVLKEVLDNSIDEYMMGYGKTIEVTVEEGTVSVRDYGRGVPLGKVVDVSSKMNTGAKYDSKAFKKSVGLNGVGIKAVNALSSYFLITSYRDGECKRVEYNKAVITEEAPICPTEEANGTLTYFIPDKEIFKDYQYKDEYIESCLLYTSPSPRD